MFHATACILFGIIVFGVGSFIAFDPGVGFMVSGALLAAIGFAGAWAHDKSAKPRGCSPNESKSN